MLVCHRPCSSCHDDMHARSLREFLCSFSILYPSMFGMFFGSGVGFGFRARVTEPPTLFPIKSFFFLAHPVLVCLWCQVKRRW